MDINVHWLTEDFYTKKKILDVLEMEENKNAVNYRNRVKKEEDLARCLSPLSPA